MNKPKVEGNTNAYFENPDRKKETDFTEVLNMSETYDELMKEANENPSDQMLDINRKFEIMLEYRRNLFIQDLELANQRSFIDLNVYF
jgi:hypothetical protein